MLWSIVCNFGCNFSLFQGVAEGFYGRNKYEAFASVSISMDSKFFEKTRKASWTMRVFISHAYKDELLVKNVSAALERVGIEVWNATRDVSSIERWSDEVEQALRDSDAMVVVLTDDALRSNWVRKEIQYALGEKGYRKRLIPVLAGNPEELHREDIPWILKRLQIVNMGEYEEEDEGINQIVRALLDNDVASSPPTSASIP